MLSQYSIFDKIKLSIYLINTKIFFKKSRLIRLPIDVRGKRSINWGEYLTTGKYCRIEAFSNTKNETITFGKNIQINDFVHITGSQSVVIGDNVLIASKVYISDTSHGNYSGDYQHSSPLEVAKDREIFTKKVVIGDNVWIGEGVSILPGVEIGMGSIIGANSVVTKNIPECTIAVGNPSKAIKKYNKNSSKWEIIKY